MLRTRTKKLLVLGLSALLALPLPSYAIARDSEASYGASFPERAYSAQTTETIAPSSIKIAVNGIEAAEKNLYIGETATLTTNILPVNATSRDVIWSTSDESIVSITLSGMEAIIKAEKKGGPVTITATSRLDPNVKGTCRVTVSEKTDSVKPTSITITNNNIITSGTTKKMYIATNSSATLTASVLPSNASNKNHTWYTSSKEIADIDQNGVLTGVSPGKTNIKVVCDADNSIVDNCEIIVHKPITGVTITGSDIKTSGGVKSLTIEQDGRASLSALITPSDAGETGVKWSSGNPNCVTVDQSGLVRGISTGTATITAVSAVDPSKYDTCTVTVNPSTIDVTGLEINPASYSMYIGSSIGLSAIVTPSNATNKEVSWSSSDSSVVYVGSSGSITGVSVGTAIITATSKDNSSIKATCNVTVLQNDISYADVELYNPTVYYNAKAQTSSVKNVTLNDEVLTEGVDYTVNNVTKTNAGSYEVDLHGIGNYTGTTAASFTIKPLSMKNATINFSSSKALTYNKKKQLKKVKSVKIGNVKLPESDYFLDYDPETAKVGKITVTAYSDSGNVDGSKSASYKIKKAGTSLKIKAVDKQYATDNSAFTFKIKSKVSSNGKLSYKVPSSAKKFIKITGDGNVTVKRDIPKGNYTITVKAAATKYYKASKSKKIKISVK